MNKDLCHLIEAAKAMSDHRLEIEAATSDSLGGSPEKRACAKIEIKRRDREAADQLARMQLATAERQAKTAQSTARAAWGSVVVVLAVGLPSIVSSLWQIFHPH